MLGQCRLMRDQPEVPCGWGPWDRTTARQLSLVVPSAASTRACRILRCAAWPASHVLLGSTVSLMWP